MGFSDDNDNNYLEVLEELCGAQNTIKRIQDIVLRTLASADIEDADCRSAFDEIYHILLSSAEGSGRISRSG